MELPIDGPCSCQTSASKYIRIGYVGIEILRLEVRISGYGWSYTFCDDTNRYSQRMSVTRNEAVILAHFITDHPAPGLWQLSTYAASGANTFELTCFNMILDAFKLNRVLKCCSDKRKN